jgi:hypothetical protein
MIFFNCFDSWETKTGKSQGSTSAMIKHLTGSKGPHGFPMGGPDGTPKSQVAFETQKTEEILKIVSGITQYVCNCVLF